VTEVISIVSGKGGVGKTTIAANLSFALKNLGKKVLLIDLNLTTPHLTYYLGFSNYSHTLNEVLMNKINELSIVHNLEGVRFVPSSNSLEEIVKINPKRIDKVLSNFKKYMNLDFIILDSAPGIGREAITSMSVSDKIILVATPYFPSINDIIKCKKIANHLGKHEMKIVLNMYDGYSYELSPQKIEEITGLEVIGCIPYDNYVNISLAAGIPLIFYKPKALASIAINQIASKLLGNKPKKSKKLILHDVFVKIKDKLFYSFSSDLGTDFKLEK